MIYLPQEAYSCVSATETDFSGIAETQTPDVSLQPMTLRFVRLDGTDEVVCQQVVGPKTGKETTNFYNKQNMWEGIRPLFPYLPEIAEKTGDVFHFACICTPFKSTVLRQPVLLVDTENLDPRAAGNWSKRNLYASKSGDEHDFLTYLSFIDLRNKAWLKKWGIQPQLSHPLDVIIDAVRDGNITQNELLEGLKQVRLELT